MPWQRIQARPCCSPLLLSLCTFLAVIQHMIMALQAITPPFQLLLACRHQQGPINRQDHPKYQTPVTAKPKEAGTLTYGLEHDFQKKACTMESRGGAVRLNCSFFPIKQTLFLVCYGMPSL